MTGEVISYALLGCGFISHKHASALAALPNAKLMAACDLNPERASAFAARFNVPTFASFAEMMDAVGHKIDVVSVLTPTGHHLSGVREAARAGKHVVVEKPMAISVAQAQQIIDECSESRVRLFVVKQNRFNRPIEHLKAAVSAGRFGKFVLATARVRWRRDESYYSKDQWRGTVTLDGGVLSNQASHHIDLLQWLLGDVERVQAMTARRLAEVETEDTAVGTLQFKNGALGVIEATTGARPADLEGSISIMGEGGSVVIEGFAANEVRTWQFSTPEPTDAAMLGEFRRNPEGAPFYALSRYLQNVTDSLLGYGEAMVDGREGLKTVRIIEALYGAARSGIPVSLEAPVTVTDYLPPPKLPEIAAVASA